MPDLFGSNGQLGARHIRAGEKDCLFLLAAGLFKQPVHNIWDSVELREQHLTFAHPHSTEHSAYESHACQ